MTYQAITVNGPIDLSWSLPYTGGLIVADYNNISVPIGASNAAINLPPANNIGLGATIVFNNVGTISCPIYGWGNNPFSGSSPYILAAGSVITIYTIDNSSAVGNWQVISSSGQIGIVSLKAQSNTNNSMVITDANSISNPTVMPSGGVLTFSCAPSIANLLNLSLNNQTGLMVARGVNPSDYGTRELLGGSNITITDGDGVSGDPQIALNQTLTNINNIGIGTTTLTSGSIGDTTALTITSPTITLATANLVFSGATSGFGLASAWVRFTDNGGTSPGNITVIDSYNIASQTATTPGVVGVQGSYTITYATALDNANYAISVSLIRGTETIAPLLAYPTSPINAQNMQLMTIDTLGNLLPVTDGVSVVVFGS